MLQASSLPQQLRPRTLSNWLFGVAALVVAMVVIGGITRLTESGLSITQWKPISGVIPPLNAVQWQAEFDNYKKIPEYQQLNRGMSMAGFQAIFFWEYLHRLLGRVVGAAYLLPLLWFWIRGRVPRGYVPRLFALVALVCFQGAIGWWMVSSGLVKRTDVSHVRLAVHLSSPRSPCSPERYGPRSICALWRSMAAHDRRVCGPSRSSLLACCSGKSCSGRSPPGSTRAMPFPVGP
jgi:heme a synthase